jgi:hypothetical protein
MPLFQRRSRYSLQSSHSNLQTVPFARFTGFCARALSVAGPALWNSLPDNLTRLRSNSFTFQTSAQDFFLQHVNFPVSQYLRLGAVETVYLRSKKFTLVTSSLLRRSLNQFVSQQQKKCCSIHRCWSAALGSFKRLKKGPTVSVAYSSTMLSSQTGDCTHYHHVIRLLHQLQLSASDILIIASTHQT